MKNWLLSSSRGRNSAASRAAPKETWKWSPTRSRNSSALTSWRTKPCVIVHAIATCAGVAPWRPATSTSAGCRSSAPPWPIGE